MKRRRALRALPVPVVLATVLGCAGLFGEGTCRERDEAARSVSVSARSVQTSCTVLRRPDRLIELCDAALGNRDFETAFAWLALVRTLYPGSAESRDVFPTAARVFQKAHLAHRTEPGSIWITSEPRFMFDWLASFFEDGAPFPQSQADAFFLGMHYGMFRDFLAWAQQRPDLARWQLVAEKDNGWIFSVAGERADAS